MKTLYLVRHAKSSWGDPALPDRDRPLNERGLRDVAAMGKRLAQRDVSPDVLMCSPATRALATAQHLAKALGIKRKDIVVIERLYAAPAKQLLGVIQELGDKPKRVMLVGHNPGLAELARHFASEIADMPTCAIAEFTFAVPSWADVGKAEPRHVVFDFPKNERP
ncbi:MAG TPA: histidine phosphatase family protein [Burkholderiaceae bacterium]|nr:histidine phosphatase family protein [Burkholderiaceae bacterium]